MGTQFVGFAARPVGAAVFGHFGDRLGRKSTLIATLMLMGTGTFLIGCLPTYATIGFAAPLALVVLRVIQGIGVGGEWGGSVTLSATTGASFQTWGWRVPFLASALLVALGLYVRLKVPETPESGVDLPRNRIARLAGSGRSAWVSGAGWARSSSVCAGSASALFDLG